VSICPPRTRPPPPRAPPRRPKTARLPAGSAAGPPGSRLCGRVR